MDLPSVELLNNNFFTFVVGPARREFTVHAGVFARLSDPLDVLINGNFAEAADKSVVWEDVDEATFDRLRQFAYCGDYNCAKPEPLKPVVVPVVNVTESDDGERQGGSGENPSVAEPQPKPKFKFIGEKYPHRRHKYRWKLPYSISNMYQDLSNNQEVTITRKRKYANFTNEICHDDKANMARAFALWFNISGQGHSAARKKLVYDSLEGEPFRNYKDLLFCHAELHMLADRYCIDKLADITAIKLGELLFRITIFPPIIRGIAAVIHYVFQNTMPHDPIRDMLMRFGAVIIEDVNDNQDWAQMLLDNPEFSFGVIQKLVKHRLPESS
ncbi:hypothetical protein Hte_005751 [Hypoxylon texense]